MQALPDESLVEEQLSLFDQICLMAVDKNEAWFATKTGVDVRKGLYTPASKLAEEGNTESVLFLIKYGANIHEAAMGAAKGRNYSLAETLRVYYGANVNFIAKGVCLADDSSRKGLDYLDYLIKKHHAGEPLIAMAAAIKGDFVYAEKLLAEYKDTLTVQEYEQEKIQGFVSGMIEGALIHGDCDYAKQLIQEYQLTIESVLKFLTTAVDITFIETLSPNNGLWLAWFAALAGNEEYCNQLMADNRWNHEEQYRQNVIEGLIAGSFLGENIHIIQNVNFFGSFESDDFQQDRLYKLSCLCTHISGVLERNKHFIQFAVASGCLEKVIVFYNELDNDLLDKKRKILQLVEDGLTQSFFYPNPTISLHQLSFVNDHAFLNILKSRKSLPAYLKNIIPMAVKINQMMKKYEIDYDQANAFLTCPCLRFYCLYFPFFLSDAILLVLSGLASLSLESVTELYDKVSLYLNKSFLASDLSAYHRRSWISHRARAGSLMQACEQTKNREDFSSLIQFQYRLFNDTNSPTNNARSYHEQSLTNASKGDYYQIIEKHALRLGI